MANQVFLGWSEPTPRGHLPQLLGPARARGPVGLRRPRDALGHGARPVRPVQEQVARARRASPTRTWSTRACSAAGRRCAGTTTTRRSPASAATTRGGSPPHAHGSYSWARDDDSRWLELGRGPEPAAVEPPLVLRVRLATRSCSTTCSTSTPRTATAAATLGARAHRPGHLEPHLPREPVDHAGADDPVLRQPVRRHRAATPASRRRPTRWRGTTSHRFHRLRPGRDRVLRGRERVSRHRGRRRAVLLVPRTPTSASASSARTSSRAGSTSPARRSTSSGRRAARATPRTGTDPSAPTGTTCGSTRPDNVFLVKLSYWFSP